MNYLSFAWTGATSLAAELRKPIEQVSLEFHHEIPMFITLWRSDGTGLRVFSQMHDVAERREVGVLNFKQVSERHAEQSVTQVPISFQGKIAAFKLTIHESGTTAESGVILKAANDDEITIVASVSPHLIAICGISAFPDVFKPEYPIENYMRVPIA
jgi:hypothetical protein